MAEEKLNIYQKLAKIRKQTEVIQKNKSGYGYKYVSIEEILSHVTAGMNKYGVSLIPRHEPGATVETYTYSKIKVAKGGTERYEEPITEFLVKIPVTYTWINNDDPNDRLEVPWFISGSQSDPSQAMGSAMTYGLRYFLTGFFQIATPEDDPDEWRSKQKEVEESEDRAIAAKIIEEFDKKVRAYLAEHKDKAADVKALVTRFVKSGDYTKITEPVLAEKLFEEFNKNFT